jgi:hypothetical protein
MARPPRGLGPRSRGIFDTDLYEGQASGSDLPQAGREFGRAGVGGLFASGEDFGLYVVDQSETYYLGPVRSSRVRGHMFVPDVPVEDITSGVLGPQFDAFNLTGVIYVVFHKRGRQGNIVVYGTNDPFTLNEYRQFRESPSKGTAVREMEGRGFSYNIGQAPAEILALANEVA